MGREVKMFSLFVMLWLSFAGVHAQKLIEVGKGYSETSVNAAVFRTNSVVTKGNTQFVAYYDGEGYLTLGKRQLCSDTWTILRSSYKGNCGDAHNIISLGIDGDGFLHVAFDHHNAPLHYCKSVAPYSLRLGGMQPMVGKDEKDVTYPEFYTLKNGDLLFVCRSGMSGRGNLVMNRYDVVQGKWQRLHDVLVDGEGQRNAYWQLCVDTLGTIHISWVWRETPAVETNHDLCYACSKDGGRTWQKSTGEKYSLPINAANAEYAFRIPQGSELINQTSMTSDADGNPYIATYWKSAKSTVPQYRLIWKDGAKWKASQVMQRKTAFSLSGTGTKMIPVSRPRLAVSTVGGKVRAYYLFRDAERGSKVSLAFTPDLKKGRWTVSDLTDFSVDAWEPSYDTGLWNEQGLLHVFVQHVAQGDGEKKKVLEPQPVYILEVETPDSPEAAKVKNLMKRVNVLWQQNHASDYSPFWDNAVYHTGNMAAYTLLKDSAWLKFSSDWAEHNSWTGAKEPDRSQWLYFYGENDKHVMFGDFQACFQTYIDLYNIAPDYRKVARAQEVMEHEMTTNNKDYWWWADGLYMVMPVMTKLYNLTGSRLYLDKLFEYEQYTESLMFDEETGLFYRDARYVYPQHQTPSGKKDFWARGDGWVIAALAKVIQDLPASDAHRQFYIERFQKMAKTLASCQQSEGYWTRSLLDPEFAPGPETSGTAFFTYGILWGINAGLLDKAAFTPIADKGWKYLSETAVQPDGSIGYVQPIGDRAIPGQQINARSTANFGVGAFLLAACERVKYLNKQQ